MPTIATGKRYRCPKCGAEFVVTRLFTGLLRPRHRISGMEFSGVVGAVGPAVTMFAVTGTTALLTILGDRSHLSEDLKNQEGT